ncbi:hypothetical protein D2Q93_01435 [Alicyclobacillaceae bacterium I2511]|nr:hypothetical protein D2Q93_01435 [Alicyclobacillaceae bacterium I2511]
MPNRILTEKEREQLFNPLIRDIRSKLVCLSNEDKELLWALRRKLAKELTYDERRKPSQRRNLKRKKRLIQQDKCAICGCQLPSRGAVLDRYEAMGGYTEDNTRLICPSCDSSVQDGRRFS